MDISMLRMKPKTTPAPAALAEEANAANEYARPAGKGGRTAEGADAEAFIKNIPFLVENRDRIGLMAGFSALPVPLPVYGVCRRITVCALSMLWRNPESGFVRKCSCGADAFVYSLSIDPLSAVARVSAYCPDCRKHITFETPLTDEPKDQPRG